MIAGQNILYFPGTTVELGGYMWGYIAPSGPFCTTPPMPSAPTTGTEDSMTIEQSFFKIYPNPTTGNFILEFAGARNIETANVQIYTMRGENTNETSGVWWLDATATIPTGTASR